MSRMSPSRKRSRKQFKLKRLRMNVSHHPLGAGLPWLTAEPLPKPKATARSEREQPADDPAQGTGGQVNTNVPRVRNLDAPGDLTGLRAMFDVLGDAGLIDRARNLTLQFRENARDGRSELVSVSIEVAPKSTL